MRLAQIEGGVVVNVAEVDPQGIPEFMGDWPELPEGAGIGWGWDGDAWTSPPGPPAEQLLAEAKDIARQRLTAAIRGARTAMITDLPGQDMIYLAKLTEAAAWTTTADPDPADYPLISAEVGITAPDADQLAQLWLNMGALWRAAAAQLEALRMSTGAAIDAAETPEEVAAALAALAVLDDQGL